MNADELVKYATCCLCSKKIGASGLPLFWRVTVERFGIDMRLVKRFDGMVAMLGGAAHIARVMCDVEDVTEPLMEKVTLSICEPCGTSSTMVAQLAELRDVLAKAST